MVHSIRASPITGTEAKAYSSTNAKTARPISPDPIVYTLGSDDRIIDIQGTWDQFAAQNSAPELRAERVLGTSLFHFIRGESVRKLYHQLFESVRQTEQDLEIPFRCDAPDRCRSLLLSIRVGPKNTLVIESRMFQEWSRLHVELLSRQAIRGDDNVTICALCRRVHVDNEWFEPVEAIQKRALFNLSPVPQLKEDVCYECEQIATGRRRYLIDIRKMGLGPQPLIVFLHGGGHAQWVMRLYAPPRLSQSNALGSGYILLSPLCPTGKPWESVDLKGILAEVQAHYPVDPTRIYLTGVSAGATAIWRWASEEPNRFAAVAPVAGLLWDSPFLNKTPVWIAYGVDDTLVPLKFVERAIEYQQSVNPRARTVPYSGHGHEIWGLVYSDPAFWSWLFSQQLERGLT